MIRLVNAMVAPAVRKRFSDIHIEPFERFRIRYQVDGDADESGFYAGNEGGDYFASG